MNLAAFVFPILCLLCAILMVYLHSAITPLYTFLGRQTILTGKGYFGPSAKSGEPLNLTTKFHSTDTKFEGKCIICVFVSTFCLCC